MKIEVATMELPFLFIDRYMTNCLPVYPLVYIYSYRHALVGRAVTSQEIEDTFQLTERDVLKVWKHWEKQGLISIDYSNDDMDITFLPVTTMPAQPVGIVQEPPYEEVNAKEVKQQRTSTPTQNKKVLDNQIPLYNPPQEVIPSPPQLAPVSSNSPNSSNSLNSSNSSFSVSNSASNTINPITPPVNTKPETIMEIRRQTMPTQPVYGMQELAEYRTQSREIAHLFAHAEQAMGKLLSPTDMSKIFSFHDWLGLPLDVVEYLLTYCADNDKRNLKYIETCAIDWAERNIEDLVMAIEYVQSFDDYNSVLRRLGLKNMTASSRKYFDKWSQQWQMPTELILNACERALENDVPKLSYVDGILKKWHEKGINTAEGVRRDDEAFENAKQLRIDSNTQYDPNKKSFANFQQRDNDLSHIEQQAWDKQMQRIKDAKDGPTWQELLAESRRPQLLKEG